MASLEASTGMGQRLDWRSLLAMLVMLLPGCRWTSLSQNTAGVALFQQGRLAEALQQFEAAKQSDPGNPDTYYNLASTYHRLGVAQKNKTLMDQAEALYNQCLDIAPNHTDCNRGLAVLLIESGRPDSGFTLMKNWAAKNPNLADARIELSRLYQEFGQPKVAEQYLDEALAMEPNNYKAWAARGRMRESSGDLKQALQNYQQSLALNNLQPEVYQRVAALNVRMAENSVTTMGTNLVGSLPTVPVGQGSTPASPGATGRY